MEPGKGQKGGFKYFRYVAKYPYPSEELLKKGIDHLSVVGKMILLDTADKVDAGKEVILRNLIARSISQLNSILVLYNEKNFNDGWIVHRSLIDRLVHLYYLIDSDSFDEFIAWSYVEDYDYRNGLKGDERFKEITSDKRFKGTKEEAKKYTSYKSQPHNWKKPDPYKVLKNRKLDFIYKYGYNFASRTVHPMSGDGDEEFHTLTGLKPNKHEGRDNSHLLGNSLLISTLVMQEVMNEMHFNFIKATYDFLNGIHALIDDCNTNYQKTFVKISKHFSDGGELSAK